MDLPEHIQKAYASPTEEEESQEARKRRLNNRRAAKYRYLKHISRKQHGNTSPAAQKRKRKLISEVKDVNERERLRYLNRKRQQKRRERIEDGDKAKQNEQQQLMEPRWRDRMDRDAIGLARQETRLQMRKKQKSQDDRRLSEETHSRNTNLNDILNSPSSSVSDDWSEGRRERWGPMFRRNTSSFRLPSIDQSTGVLSDCDNSVSLQPLLPFNHARALPPTLPPPSSLYSGTGKAQTTDMTNSTFERTDERNNVLPQLQTALLANESSQSSPLPLMPLNTSMLPASSSNTALLSPKPLPSISTSSHLPGLHLNRLPGVPDLLSSYESTEGVGSPTVGSIPSFDEFLNW